MFKKLLNRKQQGFTIIEVMIVLAIAGLIMVVVLIAIPQLQRNQRNSARVADASRLGTAIQNWVTNNNGASITGGTAAQTVANLDLVVKDLGTTMNQYTLSTSVAPITLTAAPYVAQTNTKLSDLMVLTGATCGANGTVTATGSRSFVILYATENATTTATTGTQTCIAF